MAAAGNGIRHFPTRVSPPRDLFRASRDNSNTQSGFPPAGCYHVRRDHNDTKPRRTVCFRSSPPAIATRSKPASTATAAWSGPRPEVHPHRVRREDATQDIFLDVWKSASRFNPDVASETTFVAMIARRRLIDRLA